MTTKDEVTGRAKEALGDLTGNTDMKREGKVDKAAGKVKEAIDVMRDKAKELVNDVNGRKRRR